MEPARTKAGAAESPPPFDWGELIPPEDWPVYHRVLKATLSRGRPFAVGGGFAFSAYAKRPRFTKDIDLYILPEDREPMIAILNDAGLDDYYQKLPYDREWIYRGHREGAIVDLIWAMANQRARIDAGWLERGHPVRMRDLFVSLLPPEELFWTKLYVLQRDRCDWPDLLNLLNAQGDRLDWRHLLNRVGADTPLLAAVVTVFSWMCPHGAIRLPRWIWAELGLHPPHGGPDCQDWRDRVRLLDTRDWFGRTTSEAEESRKEAR